MILKAVISDYTYSGHDIHGVRVLTKRAVAGSTNKKEWEAEEM
jgi:hypothetical protein